MLVNFTAEEEKKLAAIRDKYTPERKKLAEAYKNLLEDNSGEAKAERLKINRQQQAITETMVEEMQDYIYKLEGKRFEEIKKGGASTVIKHAAAQAPELLEHMRRNTVVEARYYEGLEEHFLHSIGINEIRNDTVYFRSSYATAYLKQELRLHISFLKDDPESLQQIQKSIQEAVQNAPFVDQVEDTEETIEPAIIKRAVRRPLIDLKNFSLTNDKAGRFIINEPELLQQEADGQIRMIFPPINQGGEKEPAVPLFMSLTYTGDKNELKGKTSPDLYDIALGDAIYSLCVQWQTENPGTLPILSPAEIYRTLAGKSTRDGKAKPSNKQLKKIVTRINKLRHLDIMLDFKAEKDLERIQWDDDRIIDGGYIKDYYLNCTELGFITIKGQRIPAGYRINFLPVFNKYQAEKGSLLYIPYDLIDVSAKVSDGENVTEFKHYLLSCIKQMIYAKENPNAKFKRSHKITISGIYENTGVLTPEERAAKSNFTSEQAKNTYIRKTRKADRDKIEGMLDVWKDKNWIKGYVVLNSKNQPIKEKQQAKGYEILF